MPALRLAATVPTALLCSAALLLPAAPAQAAPAGPTAPSQASAPSQAAPAGDGSAVSTTAVRGVVSTAAANARIGQVLRTRTSSKVLGSRFTMTVWDPASASFVYTRRPAASLRGASTTKVLTTVAALAALGADHRFPTTVRAGATPGELVLVGGGDPLLTTANLRELAAFTRDALLATPALGVPAAPVDPGQAAPPVTLTVRADDSLFGDQGLRSRGWPRSYVPRQVRSVGAFARDDRKVLDATADAGTAFAAALTALGVPASYGGEALATPEAATLATFPGHTVAEAVSRT
ncbi:MAG TPA: D-alanyl-D-alanine carboxypeptidase, partial [Candidatus Nanopelagicales bacterium]